MSDHDVRRVVRDLLRSGLNVEETFDAILEELVTKHDTGQRVIVRAQKEKERRRAYSDHSQAPFLEDIEYRVFVRVLPPASVQDWPEGVVKTETEKSVLLPLPEHPAKWVNPGNGAGDEFGGSDYP